MSTQLSRPGRPADRPVPVLTALLVMTIALGVLWLSELVDQLSGNRLDELGIHARELDGLPEIYSAPLLHAGWEHLIANSGPFFVLGLLVLLGGALRWAVATLVSVTASGLTAWLLTPLGTIVLGASGLIFGWPTYLVVRGPPTRRPGQVLLGIAVLVVYGGMIWGVLPGAAGISWQAHLGGAIGGVLAAALLTVDRPIGRPPRTSVAAEPRARAESPAQTSRSSSPFWRSTRSAASRSRAAVRSSAEMRVRAKTSFELRRARRQASAKPSCPRPNRSAGGRRLPPEPGPPRPACPAAAKSKKRSSLRARFRLVTRARLRSPRIAGRTRSISAHS